MIEESEARARILSVISRGALEIVPLIEALDRFAPENLFASLAIPAFDNSSMDGYAVRAADTRTSKPIAIVGTQPAGKDLRLKLNPGEAIRIYTGAPMPSGADAVIMQEDVDVTDGHIVCREPVEPGENIRRAGCDLCAGQRIVAAGSRFNPRTLGVLASQGVPSVSVLAPPKVAILSTGDELASPGRALEPGQIYESNSAMLAALVRGLGCREVSLHRCRDDFAATVAILEELGASHDFIIISGGVSVGDRDHVRPALSSLGMTPDFWKVRVKPGKPFVFARREKPGPLCVFGLPGNPVSSFVTFFLFVRPALLRWQGAADADLAPRTSKATLAEPLSNPDDRPHYVRGVVTGGEFRPTGLQQSHALFGLGIANALLRLDARESVSAGTQREIFSL